MAEVEQLRLKVNKKTENNTLLLKFLSFWGGPEGGGATTPSTLPLGSPLLEEIPLVSLARSEGQKSLVQPY